MPTTLFQHTVPRPLFEICRNKYLAIFGGTLFPMSSYVPMRLQFYRNSIVVDNIGNPEVTSFNLSEKYVATTCDVI